MKLEAIKNRVHYQHLGLSNLYLIGLFQDPEGDLVCPQPDKLHAQVAAVLAKKKYPLSGEELRFLREYNGIHTKSDAREKVGVALDALMAMETHKKTNVVAEKFLRLMTLTQLGNSEQFIFEEDVKKTPANLNYTFEYGGDEWALVSENRSSKPLTAAG